MLVLGTWDGVPTFLCDFSGDERFPRLRLVSVQSPSAEGPRVAQHDDLHDPTLHPFVAVPEGLYDARRKVPHEKHKIVRQVASFF